MADQRQRYVSLPYTLTLHDDGARWIDAHVERECGWSTVIRMDRQVAFDRAHGLLDLIRDAAIRRYVSDPAPDLESLIEEERHERGLFLSREAEIARAGRGAVR